MLEISTCSLALLQEDPHRLVPSMLGVGFHHHRCNKSVRYTSPQGAGNRLTKVQFDDLQEHTEQKHTSFKTGFVTRKRLMDG